MSDEHEWVGRIILGGVDQTFSREIPNPLPGAPEEWTFDAKDWTTTHLTLFEDEGDE